MSTYTVTHAFADKVPGDKIGAADLSEADIAYLRQTGAIVADNDANDTPKRARKVPTKSED
jgi:hypothetical protein